LRVKYLLVLLVIGVGLWALVSRLRGPQRPSGRASGEPSPAATPMVMVQCAHCGLHLPVADAKAEGSRLYCSDAHRLLGPAPHPPA